MYTVISHDAIKKSFAKKTWKEAEKEEFLTILEYISENPFGYGEFTGLESIQSIELGKGTLLYDVDNQNQVVVLQSFILKK